MAEPYTEERDGVWQEHLLATGDGRILWAEAGSGPLLLFLHGGPGDEYRYLRPLAEPFLQDYRCVLFDQRGSGGSTLDTVNKDTVHPDRFVDDIEALRVHLRAERMWLVGHSWGAILALLYGTAHSEHVAGVVLIGMGPTSAEMSAVARANRLRHLSPSERQLYAHLSEEKRAAIDAGDSERLQRANRQRIQLTAPALIYDLAQLESFVEKWLTAEPFRNWQVNRLVSPQIDFAALWQRLPRLWKPVLILYGYQDFEPIIQAYQLQERMPDVMLAFVNKAGHLPWLEQPEATHSAIQEFLRQNLS